MAGSLKIQGRIVKHDTKSQTKDGVDILKVGILVENMIGSEPVGTMVTFAVRRDRVHDYPIDHACEITIGTATK